MDSTTNEAKSTVAYLIDKTKGSLISKNIYSSYKATTN
ncbi:hypothetical protein SAMN05216439_0370 [Methanobrevibacter gottschalkii]|uniref:Uncharacterized protein n=1 Tax=Methanobrevibacter gottschalkii TaxID=190974 RepID=A0A1H7PFQ8_9EURY|nr:hypothetical protein SAMN05216439_0370 [Methanobrevibacter gottschalkii]